MIRALEHGLPEQDRLGRAGRDLIEQEYAWSVIVKRWLEELGVGVVAPIEQRTSVS